MAPVNPSIVNHYHCLQQLRDHEAFASNSQHASISNPSWFYSNGDRTPEGQDLHDAIVNSIINVSPPTGNDQQPVAILLAGPPGSGKSSACRALFQAGGEQIIGDLKDFLAPPPRSQSTTTLRRKLQAQA